MVAIGTAADTQRRVILAIVIPVAVIVLVTLTGGLISGVYRRARVRSSDLLGARGALSIVGFVWLIVGLTLGIAFALRAAGSAAPATIATAVGGAVMAGGGAGGRRRGGPLLVGHRARGDRVDRGASTR